MKVGLHDAEYERRKCKKFPNYALMKLSAWHKQNGDDVELFIPKDPNTAEQLSFFANADEEYPPKRDAYTYDIVYSSKVFEFTPENPFLPPTAIKGGTGYGIFTELPPEVDAMFPDYSIYPDCDYAIGYITRGCPNNCRWCVVPKKEGNIHAYRDWHDLVRPDSDKLVLMDNNVLACDYGLKQLESLIDSGYKIDLNQGMDARLITDEIAQMLSKLKWIRFLRFSCDSIPQIAAIHKTAELLGKYGIKPSKLFIYLLVTNDLANAEYRVEQLKKLRGINIYAQAERNESMGITPNKFQLEFANRYVYSGKFRTMTWHEYCEQRGINIISRSKSNE